MLQIKLAKLRRLQVVALVLWAIAFLIGTIWFALRSGHKQRLRTLYESASMRDLPSVQALAADGSYDAVLYLERLANDPNKFIEVRIAAIDALGNTHRNSSGSLSGLLSIQKPFAVRHEATKVLLRRGCDFVCVSAALYSLQALWRGDQTEEDRLAAQAARIGNTYGFSTAAQMKAESEIDYISLLNTNPCDAQKGLRDYNRSSDRDFVLEVEKKLVRCEPR